MIKENIIEKLLKYIEIKYKFIYEIGSGFGIITKCILNKNPIKLISVEIDFLLRDHLLIFFKNNPGKIDLIFRNVLDINLSNIVYKKFNKNSLYIIGSLPYNISSRLIFLWICNCNFKYALIILQYEVYLKLHKKNNTFINFIFNINMSIKKLFYISSNLFKPKPKVNNIAVLIKIINLKFKFNKIKLFKNYFYNLKYLKKIK